MKSESRNGADVKPNRNKITPTFAAHHYSYHILILRAPPPSINPNFLVISSDFSYNDEGPSVKNYLTFFLEKKLYTMFKLITSL